MRRTLLNELKPPSGGKNAPPSGLFAHTLNRHGHPFQYAVIRRAQALAEKGQSQWIFQASEFPVAVQGSDTRIDFILSQGNHLGLQYTASRLLVAECKRARPAVSNWLFARSPYVRRNQTSRPVLVERILWEGVGGAFRASGTRLDWSERLYHLAFEVSQPNQQGEPQGPSGRGMIEEAAGQVIRGVNGLVESFARHTSSLLAQNAPLTLVPAIFTTARLWTTSVDVSEASLETGHVDIPEGQPVEADWLWYQYHLSPALQHSAERALSADERNFNDGLGTLLNAEYARAIAVVSASGIDAFLSASGVWD